MTGEEGGDNHLHQLGGGGVGGEICVTLFVDDTIHQKYYVGIWTDLVLDTIKK